MSNLGDKPLSFTVYATDGDGSFALLPLLDPPTKLGSWLAMPPRSYAIPAGKRVIIPVKLAVPGERDPGRSRGGHRGLASVIVNPASSEGLLPTATRAASVWVAPWTYAGLLIILLALVALLVWFRRRRRDLAGLTLWPAT